MEIYFIQFKLKALPIQSAYFRSIWPYKACHQQQEDRRAFLVSKYSDESLRKGHIPMLDQKYFISLEN